MSKTKLQDFVKYGELFDVYGKLLNDDRQEIMKDYFQFNMTLAEISQERCVSRQAVLDSISKSCNKLDEFEEKLGFLKLKIALLEIKNLSDKDVILKKIENILKEI